MLQLRGSTQTEAFRPILPPVSDPRTSGAFSAELVNRLVSYGRTWEGAQQTITGGPGTFTYQASVPGFTTFMSSYTAAAAELLDESGYGAAALPPEAQSQLHTLVARRLIGDSWNPAKSATQNLIDAGFLGRPGQTVSVLQTTERDPNTGIAEVTRILAATPNVTTQVGDRIEIPPPRVLTVGGAPPDESATRAVTQLPASRLATAAANGGAASGTAQEDQRVTGSPVSFLGFTGRVGLVIAFAALLIVAGILEKQLKR